MTAPRNDPQLEIGVLRERLREAEETLEAIRSGEVDAVVVAGHDGVPQVYTLETADQTYRALVEEMQEGALTLALDGTILYCNRRFAQLVGDDFTGIVGTSLSRFIPSADLAAFDRIAAACGKGEFSVQALSGNITPAHFSFAELPGGESHPDALCCVVTDLTDQKKTSEALRHAHERLIAEVNERERTEGLLRQSQKMEVVGQLTGGVAHDFNNLLMAISAGLNLLDSHSNPEKMQRVKDGMRQAIDRGVGLTRQLLTFSRTKALDPVPIDLKQQLGSMQELLDRSLGGHVEVVTDFAADLWPVCVDIGEFELVLLNLCINARDAMPYGGTITIAARNEPSFSQGNLSGDFVCLTVSDTGSGMSPETIARAFEPFYTTKDIGKGSGLGLAQTYGFAQASGGQVKIESELEKGTSIHLLLPRSEVAPDIKPETITGPDVPADSERMSGHVLLVEDNEEVAAFTHQMLVDMGFDVTRVGTAAAALGALANGRRIDIVFSDVMMPGGMNGVDLTRELRTRHPDMPIVLTSGYPSAFAREAETLDVDLLAKPYTPEDLKALLVSKPIS